MNINRLQITISWRLLKDEMMMLSGEGWEKQSLWDFLGSSHLGD